MSKAAAEETEIEEIIDRGDLPPEESKDDVAEALPESKLEAEDVEEEEVVKPSVLVPKSRYDFKAAQAKQAQQRAAELEAKLKAYEDRDRKQAATPDYTAQIADLDKQIVDARKDGNLEKAFELLDQKQELRIAAIQAQAQPQTIDANAVSQAAIDSIKVDDLIDQLEAEFSILVPDSEAYDEEIVAEIQDLRAAFEGRGYSRYDALYRAANYVLGTAQPAAKDEPAEPAIGKRTTNIKGNLAAAKRIPPNASKIATPSDSAGLIDDLPQASRLTDKDFDALPESVLKRMRGDIL
jgi:acyl carrier protein